MGHFYPLTICVAWIRDGDHLFLVFLPGWAPPSLKCLPLYSPRAVESLSALNPAGKVMLPNPDFCCFLPSKKWKKLSGFILEPHIHASFQFRGGLLLSHSDALPQVLRDWARKVRRKKNHTVGTDHLGNAILIRDIFNGGIQFNILSTKLHPLPN